MAGRGHVELASLRGRRPCLCALALAGADAENAALRSPEYPEFSGMVDCDYGTRLSDRSERVRARLTVERAEPWIDGVRSDPAR
jgi:hypothetical protein